MNGEDVHDKTRRRTVTLGVGLGAVGLAGWTKLQAGAQSSSEPDAGTRAAASGEKRSRTAPSPRQPVVYLPHGGGPWPFVDIGFGKPEELAKLADYIRSLAQLPGAAPKAVLVISAHWEESVPTVMSGATPPLLFDYYGFPPESYQLTWPAPGEPQVASRVQELLKLHGFESKSDSKRGFDHGTFVPLKLAYPNADVPTVQLSLKQGLSPSEHLAIGRALQPLRDEGIFIVASGMSYHNMRGFGAAGRDDSEQFDAWLRETAVLDSTQRDQRLTEWEDAPRARAAHPREEHLLPLMVAAGAAGTDLGRVGYADLVMGVHVSAFHFG